MFMTYRSNLLRLRLTLGLVLLLIDGAQQEEDLSYNNFGERLLALERGGCWIICDRRANTAGG